MTAIGQIYADSDRQWTNIRSIYTWAIYVAASGYVAARGHDAASGYLATNGYVANNGYYVNVYHS